MLYELRDSVRTGLGSTSSSWKGRYCGSFRTRSQARQRSGLPTGLTVTRTVVVFRQIPQCITENCRWYERSSNVKGKDPQYLIAYGIGLNLSF